jgi:hypothetical protein
VRLSPDLKDNKWYCRVCGLYATTSIAAYQHEVNHGMEKEALRKMGEGVEGLKTFIPMLIHVQEMDVPQRQMKNKRNRRKVLF